MKQIRYTVFLSFEPRKNYSDFSINPKEFAFFLQVFTDGIEYSILRFCPFRNKAVSRNFPCHSLFLQGTFFFLVKAGQAVAKNKF